MSVSMLPMTGRTLRTAPNTEDMNSIMRMICWFFFKILLKVDWICQNKTFILLLQFVWKMPLLRKRPFMCEKPPAHLKPNDLVFYCKLTGEIFTDYEWVIFKNNFNDYKYTVICCGINELLLLLYLFFGYSFSYVFHPSIFIIAVYVLCCIVLYCMLHSLSGFSVLVLWCL